MRIKPNFSFQNVLIVDSQPNLQSPYSTLFSLLSPSVHVTHLQNLDEATAQVQQNSFDLIVVSSQFSELPTVDFLDQVRAHSTTKIAPLIFMIDWSYRQHHLIGTSWAGAVGILHSLSSAPEIHATLERLESSAQL